MVTLLFGAGASVPFFDPVLNTTYLTERVCSKSEWDRVIKKYKGKKGEYASIVSSCEVMRATQAMRLFKPQVTFEEIAEVLDKISSYGFDSWPTSNTMNLLIHTVHSSMVKRVGNPFGPKWGDVPFLLREIIAEAILDLENKHKKGEYQTLCVAQKGLIETLCRKDSHVSIVSLNYDDCLFDSLKGLDFEHGFRQSGGSPQCQLDIGRFMHAPKVIYFPHGQLRFQFIDNGQVTYWDDSNKANEERWKKLEIGTLGSSITLLPGKFAYHYNTFIVTGQTKDDALNAIPYSVYYQRLAIDLYKSDTIFIIGYSFGDNHINRLLMSFLKTDVRHTVMVVDYYGEPVSMTKEYADQSNILSKLHNWFSTAWDLSASDGGKVAYMYGDEVNCINETGYGWIFKQVMFYKRGYASFLKEYGEVMKYMEDNPLPRE